jgi:hypothetical protein
LAVDASRADANRLSASLDPCNLSQLIHAVTL